MISYIPSKAFSKNDMRRFIKKNKKLLDDVFKEQYKEQRKSDTDVATLIIKGMAMMVLEDVYGFGTKRLKRFVDNFDIKTQSIIRGGEIDGFDVDDMVEYFKDKHGIDITIMEEK